MSPYHPPEEMQMSEETKTIPVLSGRKEIAKAPSLPECLKLVTNDYYRPSLCVGFTSNGEWVPPASLSEEEIRALPGAIKSLEQSLQPADSDFVRIELTNLAMTVQLEDMPREIWEFRLTALLDDISNVPADIIAQACIQWRRTNPFWPANSKFLSLIGPKLHERKRLLERLKVLENVTKTPAPEGRVTREWRDTVMKRQSNPSFCGPIPLDQILADED